MHESKRIFLFANQKTIGVRKFKKCRMQETFVRSEVLTKMRFLFLCSNHSSCLILYTHTPLRPCFFFWLLSQEPCRHWSQLFQFTFTPPPTTTMRLMTNRDEGTSRKQFLLETPGPGGAGIGTGTGFVSWAFFKNEKCCLTLLSVFFIFIPSMTNRKKNTDFLSKL